MPLSWHGAPAEPGAPPRLGAAPRIPTSNPHSGSTVALRLVAQSPVGIWGAGPGGATAQLPSPVSPPTVESTWSASVPRQPGLGAARSQHRLHHSLTLSLCTAGTRGCSASHLHRDAGGGGALQPLSLLVGSLDLQCVFRDHLWQEAVSPKRGR